MAAVFSCAEEPMEPTAETSEPALPKVELSQAETAVSDVMLASAVSLLLAFSAEAGSTEITSTDGAVRLSWDERADFTTGIGVYTIELDEFTIPPDDPFGLNYNGYVLTGTVVMGSEDGVSTRMEIDLRAGHAEPDRFPVRTILLELKGYQDPPAPDPTGRILINGYDAPMEDLLGAFRLSE
jgi:hypothetical protein